MRANVRCMIAATVLTWGGLVVVAEPPTGEGWTPLFNGKDLTGWKVGRGGPEKDVPADGDWKVIDGVIDYNAKDGLSLWTGRSYGDFVLHIEWRMKTASDLYGKETDDAGNPIRHNPDSGVFLRGTGRGQINIWLNPMGSGEMWGLRTDKRLPEEEREKQYRPATRADKPLGEWNTFDVTMKGKHITVLLNGAKVIDAPLPEDFPSSGPIALQHHGKYDVEKKLWPPAASTVQFRNIYIKELPAEGP
ncbi:MAG: DUF1080 domain-containing protein [Planctomycetota bacterium]